MKTTFTTEIEHKFAAGDRIVSADYNPPRYRTVTGIIYDQPRACGMYVFNDDALTVGYIDSVYEKAPSPDVEYAIKFKVHSPRGSATYASTLRAVATKAALELAKAHSAPVSWETEIVGEPDMSAVYCAKGSVA
jgi:hypothetical protein